MAGNGLAFVINSLAYDVDPRLLVGIASAETTLGTNICPDNPRPTPDFNAWNYFWDGRCPGSPFQSWAGAIRVVTKFLRTSYIDIYGAKTTQDLLNNPKHQYCAVGCKNWLTHVNQVYSDLHGDPSNLRFQAQKVFFDDIEGNLDGWTATGFWHAVTNPDVTNPDVTNPEKIRVIPEIYPTLVTLAPHESQLPLANDGFLPTAKSKVRAWWYGENSTGTYVGSDFREVQQFPLDGGTSVHPNSGDLITPVIDLTGLSHAYLVFWTWWEIESVDADRFDILGEAIKVEVSAGSSFEPAGILNPAIDVNGPPNIPFVSAGYDFEVFNPSQPHKPLDWMPVGADLTPYVGRQIRIRFRFDTRDQLYNGFRGWLIDDVAVFGIPQ